MFSWAAHTGFVRGITFTADGNQILSCGSDKLVQLWKLPSLTSEVTFDEGSKEKFTPVTTWMGKNAFYSIDHQRKSEVFATTSVNHLQIWTPERSEPTQELTWGEDSLISVRFNPIETHVIATCAEDRAITLYDLRGNTPIKKLVMDMKSNCIAWNPMEAFNFTIGNEDHNCYTFDMRNLDTAKNVHVDHVAAVLGLDYSPTGQEFVTGSYDRTLRIFPTNHGHSREVYHTKRMQRIFSVSYSGDSTYIFAGSDDTNIRVWKSVASQNLGVVSQRQKKADEYNKTLIERHKQLPEIKRINRHRHVPKPIKQAQATKGVMKKSSQRKTDNLRRHSAPGRVPYKSERKKHIVQTQS